MTFALMGSYALYICRGQGTLGMKIICIFTFILLESILKKKKKKKFLAAAVARKERNDMFSCPDMTACYNLHSSV